MIAYITIGVSASGKTTWAKQLTSKPGWVNINRDDIRFGLIGCEDWSKWNFSKENENKVTEIHVNSIEQAAKAKKNIVVSDTNINFNTRDSIARKLLIMGYSVRFVWFDIPLDEALKRNSARTNPVKPSVIDNQYVQYLKACSWADENGFHRPQYTEVW